MSYKISKKSSLKAYSKIQVLNVKKELEALGNKTLSRARMFAPELTKRLKFNGRVEKMERGVRVVFGDNRTPYARRRHFENRKNPHTKNYLSRAGDGVIKEGFVVLKGGK